ncbi:Cyclin-D-binding Myb-like transcription factor 1 [Coemansia brasiliensis]|uniref:Cyclin-D-binding Myb-like transcription factor 1 n=1 Tax=Coemansia brasiliensis TaxID=2650707 RepID=A0A9W8I9U4_9FUNG|nr:Cyclin-D-binding Myb-like transcription factor 1 [Coemansia brasiliensis]
MLLHFVANLSKARSVLAMRRNEFWPLLNRQYSSAISEVPPELQQKIAASIRAYKGTTVAWFDLVTKYKLPQPQLEEIFAHDEAERLKRQKLSVKITNAAQQRYENGRCDWEAVAKDFDMPLLECLELYDASQSSISPRLFPKLVDWPYEDLQLLQQFVNNNFNAPTAKEWNLVGTFMNVGWSDCTRAYELFSKKRMGPEVVELITKYREEGLKWKDIYLRVPFHTSYIILSRSYHIVRRRLGLPSGTKSERTKWTDAETDRVRELFQKHHRPGIFKPVVDIIKKEFPEKTRSNILSKINVLLRKACITHNDMDNVKRLVDKLGEDWAQIAQELHITKKRAQRIWTEHQRHLKYSRLWTDSELTLLRECVHKGLNFTAISKQLGTKSADSCRCKWRYLQQKEAAGRNTKTGAPWTVEDIEQLQRLTSKHIRDIDWVEVSQKLNRTPIGCKYKYFNLNRQNRIQNSVDYTEVVSRAVRKQYYKDKCVDWAQISTALGLSQLDCLEANEFSEGKNRWRYDPETFSQEMADRMTQFIKTNYPYPTPVNYQAVSNYMWIDKEDCFKMAKLLDGKIEWTTELKERAIALRKQGMSYKDITKQMAPNVFRKNFMAVYYQLTKSSARPTLSSDDKAKVKELVYQHAGQMPFLDLKKLICSKLPHLNSNSVRYQVFVYASFHPAYKSRLEKADHNAIYNRIMNGAKPRDIAADLGVPSILIYNMVNVKVSAGFTSKWTAKETKQLEEFIKSTPPPYKWEKISALLGTKSAQQCCTMYMRNA